MTNPNNILSNNFPIIFDYISNSDTKRCLDVNDNNFEKEFVNGEILGTWDDEKFMFDLVRNNGLLLEAGTEKIRKNKKICLEAVRNNLSASKYIHNSIRNEVMKEYISTQKNIINISKKMPNSITGFIREEVYNKDNLDDIHAKPMKKVRTIEKELYNIPIVF